MKTLPGFKRIFLLSNIWYILNSGRERVSSTRWHYPRRTVLTLDLHEALKIVGKCASSGDKQFSEIPGLGRFGELFLFTKNERKLLEALSGLTQQSVARPAPPRPLS